MAVAVVTTPLATVTDTTDSATYVSSSGTPAQDDYLVCVVGASQTATASPTLTASANGITFTLAQETLCDTGADRLYIFVADQLVGASPSAMTVTVDLGADAGTGCHLTLLQVTGLTAVPTNQVAEQENKAGASTATVTFAASTVSGNAVIGAQLTNNNPVPASPPSGWTENYNLGYTTPTTGMQVVNSVAHASTTVTWGSNSGAGGAAAIELLPAAGGGGATVNAVAATGSGAAVAPAVTGAAVVTGVAATTSATAIAPAVAGAATVNAVTGTANATAPAPGVTGSAVVAAVRPTATATALPPTVTAGSSGVSVAAIAATAMATAIAPTLQVSSVVQAVCATATAAAAAPGVAGTIVLRFSPPTYERPINSAVRPLNFFRQTYAQSLVRINGTLRLVNHPTADQLKEAGEAGVDYFIGGHIYQVSNEVALELLLAGYSIDGDPIGYGVGYYGAGQYGD